MAVDKAMASKLARYAQIFKDARERGANESDTVMYLVRMFEDILGFDSLANEISKEVSIKDKYCDFCTKIDGEIEYLVEAKSAAHKTLKEKDIEQAENYASRSGITWVVLTNGIDWHLYHLVFAEQEGITHDLVFSFNLLDEIENDIDKIWSFLRLISKEGLLNDELETYLAQKKVLSPSSLIKILVSDPVLTVVRRELNRVSEFRLDIDDIFNSVRYVLSKDALMEAGDLCYKKKKRRKKRASKKEDVIENTSPIITEEIGLDVTEIEKKIPVSESQKPSITNNEIQNKETT
jgi:hypothetical protein